MVARVRDEHRALRVDRDARWELKLPPTGAFGAPLSQRLAGRRELLNPTVAGIGHVQIRLAVNGHGARPLELAGAPAHSAPLGDRLPGRRKLLNPVIIRVRHVDVATPVDRHTAGSLELAGP